jgi:hypothetical protein
MVTEAKRTVVSAVHGEYSCSHGFGVCIVCMMCPPGVTRHRDTHGHRAPARSVRFRAWSLLSGDWSDECVGERTIDF